MTWSPLQTSVDKILLSGEPSPGLAVVEGADVARALKERKGYGLSGATVVFSGVPLVHFAVRLTLYTQEDWDDWNAWKGLLFVLPRDKVGALDIWHPVLEEIGVKAVLVEGIGQPVQGDTGEWTIVLKFSEQRAPKKTVSKPDGAAATAAPRDPTDILIDQRRAEVERLAAMAAQ